MKNKLLKDTFREIKGSFSRFISIFAIIAIGVGFFAGVKAGSPDMKITAHDYYKKNNLMDLRLISTMGFTEDDLQAIKDTDGVKEAMGSYFVDAFVEFGQSTGIMRLHSYNKDANINKPWLIEGRMPNKSGECLVEVGFLSGGHYKIGDTISLKSGTDDPLTDTLKITEYKIVGAIHSPQYISYDRGNTNIGNGHIDFFAMIPKDDFKLDYYIEVYLTGTNTIETPSYSSEYDSEVKKLEKSIEKIAPIREDIRYQEIIDEANKELDKAKSELADGKKKLEDAKRDLEKGKRELNKNKKKAEKEFAKNQETIDDGYKLLAQKEEEFKKEIKKARDEIDKGYEEIAKGEADYQKGLKTLEASRVELETLRQTLESSKDLIPAEEYAALKMQYQQGLIALEHGEAELKNAKEELDKGKLELVKAKEELTTQEEVALEQFKLERAKLDEAQKSLDKAKKDFKKEIKKAEAEIRDAEVELKNGESEIREAEEEIRDAEREIDEIEKPEWMIFTRDDNPAYSEFGENADRIDAIASVFPVFFLLVALLVSLTTMTRMVEEERTYIGTLKALGYNKIAIVSKYFIYANLASVTGSIFGLVVGFRLFPWVIFTAYGMMYDFPPVITPFHFDLATYSVLAALLCTSLAVLLACYKELGTQPAQLMRPKAPKAGKRVLIERIPFIWNRMNFTAKVTARNIFRYKKRMLMTVIGISGCTALMLTGFGIKDSISDLSNKQFGEIAVYDMMVVLDKNKDINNVIELLKDEDNVEAFKEIHYETVTTTEGKDSYNASVFVPRDQNDLDKFINLKTFELKEPIKLNDDGVVISYKLSELLEKNIGDTLLVEDTDGNIITLKIAGITENYLGHYLYMTEKYYEENFTQNLNYNAILANMMDNSEGPEEELSEKLYEFDEVMGINFMRRNIATFDDMIVSLNLVVVVLIISASLLAFVVLYNLTNINVNERIREIATIKVLGFYDKEVSAYIYRENIVLTIIGTFVGFGLGVILHKFVISTAELNDLMFGREIFLPSYVISGLLTIVFALLVNIAVHFRLKKVNMIESLKSVE